MAYPLLTMAQIRADMLRDIRNLLPEADTGPDSDYFIRATSVASAVEGLYQHQAWMVRQIFPDTADHDYLLLHARLRGLEPKPAVAASGRMLLRGNPGSPIAAGIQGKWTDQLYVSREAGLIGADGTATVAASAALAGFAGNAPDDARLELLAPPPGMQSAGQLVEMRGGVEEESDAELLARLLDLIRRPPAGGNVHDYRRWALEVPGVSAAYVYPLRRGLGTVDIIITSAGGLPSVATLAAAQAHIDALRPVTARHSLVAAPAVRLVDVELLLSLSGLTLEQARLQLTPQLHTRFDQLAPGQLLIRSQLETLASSLPGVVDRRIVLPAANVQPLVNEQRVEWLRLGRLDIKAMP
ncbi:baseplate J/gp47 family protein [Aquitalea palustris]|uniref:Baseplate J/gp47 family protein n=1 Tax=Aquitalea palustris TaxID=2480983 RepID=A0A454JKM7_9NEIS|nr:baseplate J/gp47 family protein [Aquitalea palustris]RMC99887.1 baseplate J/gp47 family protein [Aquitalea palustris]